MMTANANLISQLRKIILGFSLLLFSCSGTLPSTSQIEGLSVDELNKDILLEAPVEWNTFQLGETITLSITNISSNPIVFDPNFGRKIFIYNNSDWIEKEDQIKNFHVDEFIVSPISEDPTSIQSTSIHPILEGITKKTNVRIFVVGNIYTNGQKETKVVGAYIDMTLSP